MVRRLSGSVSQSRVGGAWGTRRSVWREPACYRAPSADLGGSSEYSVENTED